MRRKIAVIMGTRPEAIKMAPVVEELKRRSQKIDTVVITTAQHRQMLDQALTVFKISPDVDLNLMAPNQSLADLTARVIPTMAATLASVQPDLLLVQGDTTTVFAASLAASYLKIPVGHVEAGLRSHDIGNPFPEEINRRLTSQLTELHFAPTQLARQRLLDEGVHRDRVIVTGNTVVDAVQAMLDTPFVIEETPLGGIPFQGHRVVLVTSHRRESWGNDLRNTCLALKDLVNRFQDLLVVYPVHMNPNVRETVLATLANSEWIHLIEPLDYLAFVNLMRRAHLIVTDSGGVQEEAPTLKKPLLVLRKLTERPEAFQAGLSKVIGTEREAIVAAVAGLLNDPVAYDGMTSGDNPYGDGRAADRIAEVVCRWCTGLNPLIDPEREFRGGFSFQVQQINYDAAV